MPANTNMVIYIRQDSKALSTEEQIVKNAGYPYVSTTILPKGGRLNVHQHSSANTHYVVSGSIAIRSTSH